MLSCGVIWLYQEDHTSIRTTTALIVCVVLRIRFAGKEHHTGNRIHGGKEVDVIYDSRAVQLGQRQK